MVAGGGPKKGGSFERKIAKELSSWLYDHPDFLWRIGGSGGRATRQIRLLKTKQGHTLRVARDSEGKGYTKVKPEGRLMFSGDIVPAGFELPFPFQFHVECKHHRVIDLYKLLSEDIKSGLLSWWSKAEEEAAPAQPIRLLVVRQNHRPTLVVMSKQTWLALAHHNPTKRIRRFTFPTHQLVIMKMADMLKFQVPDEWEET